MKFMFLLFLYSCSQVSVRKEPPTDLVTVETALDHLRASYMKGCVDAAKELERPGTFVNCRDKAQLHYDEVKTLMMQDK
jgi:hypothetical protein